MQCRKKPNTSGKQKEKLSTKPVVQPLKPATQRPQPSTTAQPSQAEHPISKQKAPLSLTGRISKRDSSQKPQVQPSTIAAGAATTTAKENPAVKPQLPKIGDKRPLPATSCAASSVAENASATFKRKATPPVTGKATVFHYSFLNEQQY